MEESSNFPNGRRRKSSKTVDQVKQPSDVHSNESSFEPSTSVGETQKDTRSLPKTPTILPEKDVDSSIRLLSARVDACTKLIVLITLAIVFVGWTAFALSTGNLVLLAWDTGPAALFTTVAHHILLS